MTAVLKYAICGFTYLHESFEWSRGYVEHVFDEIEVQKQIASASDADEDGSPKTGSSR
ncbi:MAG: hypothetical protein OXF04_09990 [bacterium]|nr:hypothetical protein [bacterium]MCY4271697.1 hypothetical protein [bacterium]